MERTLEAIATKLCTVCGGEFPLTSFRLRYANGTVRHCECTVCHRRSKRVQKQRRQDTKLSTIAADVHRHRECTSKLEIIAGRILRAFNGPDQMIQAICNALQRSLENKKPVIAGRLLIMLTELAVAGQTEAKRRRADVECYSDGELDDELESLLEPLVKARVAERLKSLGVNPSALHPDSY